ncbi:MAG: DUF1080 domain-containing protein [Fibrobacteria bacterium]
MAFVFPAHVQGNKAVNTLSQAEEAQGWQLMFDGKSLTGWHSFKMAAISENGWIIKDSSIYLRGPAVGALLAPEAFSFRNFEIAIDWKIADGGNSGIFLRYLETEASENIRTGPESQVCGKSHIDYKTGTTVTSPGACYAMYPPAKLWIKSTEQYNTFHVVMYEKRVAHFGNGIRLLEYTIGSDDWSAKYDTSKYSKFPLYGEVHAGKLFLQDHASPVWFRNIKIRPLAADPWANPDYIWPDQVTGNRVLTGPSASPPRVRLASDPAGRLRLEISAAASWELGLHDALGHRMGEFRGAGTGSRILELPGGQTGADFSSAFYYLSGTLDGRPLDRPIAIRPTP